MANYAKEVNMKQRHQKFVKVRKKSNIKVEKKLVEGNKKN